MFFEVQLDKDVSYGATGGPTYSTIVVSTPSRQETRIQQNSRAYMSWKIMLHDKNLAAIQALQSFFMACQGKTHGFRFKDNRDYKCVNEPLSNFAGGTTVQLIKTYGASTGRSEARPIRKPQQNLVPVTLQRSTDGGTTWNAFAASGNWSIDTTTGVILFTADQTGKMFRWSGQFDVPVRFDTDVMDPVWEAFGRIHWDNVPIIEIVV